MTLSSEKDYELLAREKNDCVVLALAQAFDISYSSAHSLCEKFGRQQGEGMYFTAKLAVALKSRMRLIVPFIGKKVKAVNFEPDGIYIVQIVGHLFCVRDKKSLDGMDNSTKVITRCWRVVALEEKDPQ